jgi:uncharacterized tellurite resistance protein B-like protein
MLDALRRLFDKQAPAPAGSPSERDLEVRVATAALLFEVVRADGTVDEAERTVMRAAVQSTFDLTSAELEDVVRLAEEASAHAVSLYEFTQVVNGAFSPPEKKRIVELLWLVAFADARKDALEEHVIRKVAGLLEVSHPDFIDAKIRARSAGTGEGRARDDA